MRFNLKQRKMESRLTQIMLVTTVDGRRIRVYTKLRVEPRYWDGATYRCRADAGVNQRERSRLAGINRQLVQLEQSVLAEDERLADRGGVLSADVLRRVVTHCLTGGEGAGSPLEYLRRLVTDYAGSINRRGKRGIDSTVRTYRMALERHAAEAAQAVEQTEIGEMDKLSSLIEQWGYQAAVFSGGRVTAGESEGMMSDLAEYFAGDPGGMDGKADIYSIQGATVAAKYIPEEDCFLAAAYFPEENPLLSSLRQIFFPFLGVLVLAGAAAIAVILLLASFFTRKMNRLVMEPVEQLAAGAERIRDGNLKEEIRYEGEEEFERVCRTFNAMQHTILEDQRQRERNEKARTDMMTGISHDLRTPLTSIRGYIKGVLDGVADTDEKRKLYLQTAYESTEDMNILLQKLFDFSRMESGQMPFHMVKVDLAEFTSAWIAQKESTLNSLQVRLSFLQEGA